MEYNIIFGKSTKSKFRKNWIEVQKFRMTKFHKLGYGERFPKNGPNRNSILVHPEGGGPKKIEILIWSASLIDLS